MANNTDSKTLFVMDLPNGYKLWRCLNGAGVPYSYITDSKGGEIMSNIRAKEFPLLLAFYRYELKRDPDERVLLDYFTHNRQGAKNR